MVQTCSKCSRANPVDAVYCYFDGFVLGGHSRKGGPLAAGTQAFPHPFVFPSGRQCCSFDELALACEQEWAAARDLLRKGFLEDFFSGLGRLDLALAAKEAAKFPNPDRGLDQLLGKLPTEVLAEPHLRLETQEVNLGVLSIDAPRSFQLHLENHGMRLLYGTILVADANWLTVGDAVANEKHFQFQHELSLSIRVRPDKLRAGTKPLEAHLEIESNGGCLIVVIRASVPIKPFPVGVLAGAKSPRQVAEKAKASSKEAALLFENGAVADWYASNGWTYPVQGPTASGIGAVQQFFEALGLTVPPKVEISANRLDLTGNAGDQLRHTLEIKSQEKRPIYAHATSNQPWLEVSRANLNGRVAVINLSVPSVPNREGETLTAKLIVQSNGNQRFVVPVTLQVGNSFVFDDLNPMTKTLSAPAILVPPVVTSSKGSGENRRPVAKKAPPWIHLVPAFLLFLAVLTAVVIDRFLPKPAGIAFKDEDVNEQERVAYNWKYDVKDPDPWITVRSNPYMRFGLEMSKEKDPENQEKYKRLTYDDHGKTNNTIVQIDGHEYYFGEPNTSNVWADKGRGKQKPLQSRKGWTSTMDFNNEKVQVMQHVEIVPGQSGYLDTLLVYYTIANKDDGKHKVGIRVMIDTYIGTNDGVPFTIPGKKGFLDTKADFNREHIPDYIEVIEKPDDPKDPGTVARMGLRHIKLPGIDLEDMEKLRICRFPGERARWEWEPESITVDEKDKDSCVALYWTYQAMSPGETRHMAFTYGLGSLDIGGTGTALALSVPASVQPDTDFVVTAYVWRANKGDKVKLQVPNGLKLAAGETDEKTVEESGARSQVFWHLRSGDTGTYMLEAATKKDNARPKQVVVKTTSIFG